jgi:hypothetical protein
MENRASTLPMSGTRATNRQTGGTAVPKTIDKTGRRAIWRRFSGVGLQRIEMNAGLMPIDHNEPEHRR